MSEENNNPKNDMHQIISSIIEVTMLTMKTYNAKHQSLCDLKYCGSRYNVKLLEFKISTENTNDEYECNGTISISEDGKQIDFIAELKIVGRSVGRIHIGFLNDLKIPNVIEVAADGYPCETFKLVNGHIRLAKSVALEDNKKNQAFTKKKKD